MQTATTTNQLVTFQLEDEIFGIDIMKTQEILKMSHIRKIPNAPYYFEGMLNLRGTVIPIINFKKMVSFGTFDLSREKGIIIVKIEDIRFGIVIDKVLRVISLEYEEIQGVPEAFPAQLKQYLTGVIDYQKNYVSILDIRKVFNEASIELTAGSESRHSTLNFHRNKLEFLSNEDDKVITQYIKSVGFNTNMVTNFGIRNFFARHKLKSKTHIHNVVQQIQNTYKNSLYNPFEFNTKDYFFDNDEDYIILLKVLEEVIFPRKLKEKNLQIKIVNLGCGKGEEVYSILLMLKSLIPDFDRWNIKLLGVDDKYNKLKEAGEGIYQNKQLKRINKKDIQTFFDEEKGLYRIKSDLRDRVLFKFASAKNLEAVQGVDLFFCRGVASSLDNESIHQFVDTVIQSLNIHGILLLSELEDLMPLNNPSLSVREINGRLFYVRIE